MVIVTMDSNTAVQNSGFEQRFEVYFIGGLLLVMVLYLASVLFSFKKEGLGVIRADSDEETGEEELEEKED